MANLILGLITVAIVLGATAGLVRSSLAPQSDLADSFKELRQHTSETVRTNLASLGVTVLSAGARVDYTVSNSGQVPVRDPANWDVIVAYEDVPGTSYNALRLTYTQSASPAAGEWTVEGIYEDAGTSAPEIFQPGIVDPGEEFVITAALNPSIGSGTVNSITLAVSNGVTVTQQFAN